MLGSGEEWGVRAGRAPLARASRLEAYNLQCPRTSPEQPRQQARGSSTEASEECGDVSGSGEEWGVRSGPASLARASGEAYFLQWPRTSPEQPRQHARGSSAEASEDCGDVVGQSGLGSSQALMMGMSSDLLARTHIPPWQPSAK